MANTVTMKHLPGCDIPECVETARYDSKTKMGPWAYLCPGHWAELGVGMLGTGAGQRLERSEWSTTQLQEEFEVEGFSAPFVVVVRKSDRQRGSLNFDGNERPRVYRNWMADA